MCDISLLILNLQAVLYIYYIYGQLTRQVQDGKCDMNAKSCLVSCLSSYYMC